MTRRNAVTIGIVAAVMAIAGAVHAAPIVHEGTPNGYPAPERPDPVPINLKISIELYNTDTFQGVPSTRLTTAIWFSEPGVYDFNGDQNLSNFIAVLSNGYIDDLRITLLDQDGYSQTYLHEDLYLFALESMPNSFEITGVRLNVIPIDQPIPDRHFEGGVILRFDAIGVPEPATLVLSVIGLWGFRIMRKR